MSNKPNPTFTDEQIKWIDDTIGADSCPLDCNECSYDGEDMCKIHSQEKLKKQILAGMHLTNSKLISIDWDNLARVLDKASWSESDGLKVIGVYRALDILKKHITKQGEGKVKK